MKQCLKNYAMLWLRCLVTLPFIVVNYLCRILVGTMALVGAVILGEEETVETILEELS